ncbi:hypothetical protein BASA81_004185 [Batrachochytrium salamandrivorans]|nr:hypothetical protein BASA81_004185 [Batrachochytrium salamandrivorans]
MRLLLLAVVVAVGWASANLASDAADVAQANAKDQDVQDGYEEVDFANDEEEGHLGDGDGAKFLPKNMLSLELNSEGPKCFYQHVESVPATIRGAWFVSTAGTATIHATVKRLGPRKPRRKPKQQEDEDDDDEEDEDDGSEWLLDQEVENKDNDKFEIVAKTLGVYSFCFENPYPNEDESKVLTFSIDVEPASTTKHGSSGNGAAKAEHIIHITETTRDLESTIESLQTELEVILLRFSAQAESQDFTEQRVTVFTAVETLVLLVVTLGQVYYVRRLVNGNRLWV